MMLKAKAATQKHWQNPNWYRALTLAERAIERQYCKDRISAVPGSEIAEQILQSWKAQRPFNQGSYFAQRLAMDSLTEDGFLTLLSETIHIGQEHTKNPPSWVEWLAASFDDLLPLTGDFASQEAENG